MPRYERRIDHELTIDGVLAHVESASIERKGMHAEIFQREAVVTIGLTLTGQGGPAASVSTCGVLTVLPAQRSPEDLGEWPPCQSVGLRLGEYKHVERTFRVLDTDLPLRIEFADGTVESLDLDWPPLQGY